MVQHVQLTKTVVQALASRELVGTVLHNVDHELAEIPLPYMMQIIVEML